MMQIAWSSSSTQQVTRSMWHAPRFQCQAPTCWSLEFQAQPWSTMPTGAVDRKLESKGLIRWCKCHNWLECMLIGHLRSRLWPWRTQAQGWVQLGWPLILRMFIWPVNPRSTSLQRSRCRKKRSLCNATTHWWSERPWSFHPWQMGPQLWRSWVHQALSRLWLAQHPPHWPQLVRSNLKCRWRKLGKLRCQKLMGKVCSMCKDAQWRRGSMRPSQLRQSHLKTLCRKFKEWSAQGALPHPLPGHLGQSLVWKRSKSSRTAPSSFFKYSSSANVRQTICQTWQQIVQKQAARLAWNWHVLELQLQALSSLLSPPFFP